MPPKTFSFKVPQNNQFVASQLIIKSLYYQSGAWMAMNDASGLNVFPLSSVAAFNYMKYN